MSAPAPAAPAPAPARMDEAPPAPPAPAPPAPAPNPVGTSPNAGQIDLLIPGPCRVGDFFPTTRQCTSAVMPPVPLLAVGPRTLFFSTSKLSPHSRVQLRGLRYRRISKDTAGEFTTGSLHLGPSSDAGGSVADRTRDCMLVGRSSSTRMPPFQVRKTNRPIFPSGRSTVWKIGRNRGEFRCSRGTLEPDARQFRRDLVLSAGSLSEHDHFWGEADGLTTAGAGATAAGTVTGTRTCRVTGTWRATCRVWVV